MLADYIVSTFQESLVILTLKLNYVTLAEQQTLQPQVIIMG